MKIIKKESKKGGKKKEGRKEGEEEKERKEGRKKKKKKDLEFTFELMGISKRRKKRNTKDVYILNDILKKT